MGIAELPIDIGGFGSGKAFATSVMSGASVFFFAVAGFATGEVNTGLKIFGFGGTIFHRLRNLLSDDGVLYRRRFCRGRRWLWLPSRHWGSLDRRHPIALHGLQLLGHEHWQDHQDGDYEALEPKTSSNQVPASSPLREEGVIEEHSSIYTPCHRFTQYPSLSSDPTEAHNCGSLP